MSENTEERDATPDAQAPPAAAVLREIDLSLIDADPNNARRKLSPAADAELTRSIEQHGVLQPVRVRPIGDRYQLVMGERRVRCSRSAGRSTVPAIVVQLDDDLADEQGLIENLQRVALDDLDLATKLVTMIHAGRLHDEIGHAIGKSRAWVARRASLANLAPVWVKSLRKIARPVPVLEQIALLGTDDQVELFKRFGRGPLRLEAIRGEVSVRTQALKAAPWKLDDAELVPRAGPCTECVKHSGHRPGLFDEENEAGKVELEQAVCLDSVCWRSKLTAVRDVKLAEARAKHGDALTLIEGNWVRMGIENPKGAEVLHEYSVRRCARKAKGATPAFVVSGRGAGSTIWISMGSSTSSSRPSKPKVDKPTPGSAADLKDKRARLQRKRDAHFVDAVRAAFEGWKAGDVVASWNEGRLTPDHSDRVLELVGLYGVAPCVGDAVAIVRSIIRERVAPRLQRLNAGQLAVQTKLARSLGRQFLGDAEVAALELQAIDACPKSKTLERIESGSVARRRKS